MEILAAAFILLTAIAYLVVRVVIFVVALRREKRASPGDQDPEQE
jgi:hypothetical protein